MPRRWAVNLDSMKSVAVAMLVTRLGRISDIRMSEICTALNVAVACGSEPGAERLAANGLDALVDAHRDQV